MAGGVAALGLSGITKRFGALTAVDDVSLSVRPGTVHALLGENGAGKSTLMRVAFGMLQPDRGSISLDGKPRRFGSPADAIDAGIGMIHQHFTNVPAMTVAENVALGLTGRYDARVAADRVREIGSRTGLLLDPEALASHLPVGAQQRLEILKALGRGARILVLDEPTAVLAPAESEELLKWLRDFASTGNSVVLITHKLAEAMSIADDVTVLRRGQLVLSSPAAGLTTLMLATALLGEEPARGQETTATAPGHVVARLKDADILDGRGVTAVKRASMEFRAGEIVGIAAVEGAGQRELLRALAGRVPVSAGKIDAPKAAGFIPEDRHGDALVLDFSQTENVALRGSGARRGVIRWAEERNRTRDLVKQMDVRGGSVDRSVRRLSGGNQQKLVLGRELDEDPSLVVAENPTRGLDIRATRDVHDRLRRAAAAGAAVVVYSSDLDEVLALATRVLVIHAGELREVPGDRDSVGKAMLGIGGE
jgi:ABC-type uncharacterized transport system ATPase subunit